MSPSARLGHKSRAQEKIGASQCEHCMGMHPLLDAFRSRLLPSPESDSPPLFPTPPQATWGDLRMRFLDGHTVSVPVGGVSATLSYQEMGMRDHRSQKPTLQWELLREFASGRGRLALSRKGVERLNQKRRENLARDLKAFFRIPG